jgi:purine-nucleoside phosphorylase
MIEKVKKTVLFLKDKGITEPTVGVILGTGLGELVKHMDVDLVLDYADIPGFPISTVEFHKGKLYFGKIGSQRVLTMQGRFHMYEGYTLPEIVFPVRVMKLLGIQQLFLSNAAGGMNPNFKKGDLVQIEDHLNFQGSNPLIGKNIDELGPRFPDMSEPYSALLNQRLHKQASELGLELKKGVYVAVTGPNLETRAEYRFLRTAGADMVGMSTVPEVIAANHMSLPCAAISVITDECDPDNLKPINIEEIIAVAGKADKQLSHL